MSKLMLVIISTALLAISGCANMSGQKSAPQTGAKSLDAIGVFENTRKEEILAAERVRTELSAAFQGKKGAENAVVEPLSLTQASVTDKITGKTQNVTVFDSLAFVMPLAMRRTPAADQVNMQIKTLANKLADDRGSSQILFMLQASDAKANGIKLDSASADSPKGNPVKVTRTADKSIPKGMQKVIVKASPMGNTIVATEPANSAAQPAPSAQTATEGIREVADDSVKSCRFLGDVAGSDAIFIGLSAGYGSKRAKAKAMTQATEFGADTVVWSQRGTSLTNEWIGKGYACGTPKAPQLAGASTTTAPTQASPISIAEINPDSTKGCKMLGDVAGSDAIFVGLSASYGSKRAKEKAMTQATELGADAIAWSQRGTSMTNEWIGTAFRCKR